MIDTRDCVAQIHHGPGHQTISRCIREGAHDIHECAPMGIVLRWRGDVGFTDVFDNSPYIGDA